MEGPDPPPGFDWHHGYVRDNSTGGLLVDGNDGAVTLVTSDIEIGAVELKNATTDDRAAIDSSGRLSFVLAPSALGGLDVFRTLDATAVEQEVKATGGKLYGWYIHNDGAAKVYVKFYDATAAAVVVGTTTPRMTVPLPAGAAANVEFTNGITFAAAICVAATTGVADANTVAPAANQVVANVLYK